MKHFLILSLFISFAASAEARHPVIQESLSDAQSFRFESAQPEKEAVRDVAGESFKRGPQHRVERDLSAPEHSPSESGSEVQYWQYSE